MQSMHFSLFWWVEVLCVRSKPVSWSGDHFIPAVLPLCVCLSVTNFRSSFLSNYSSLVHSSFWHAYGGIHFCRNLMSTSCLSVHLYVECIRNFHHSFLSNYSSQMLEILMHSLFWHATWWDPFCTNLTSISCSSVRLSVECISIFRHSFLSNYSSQMLEFFCLLFLLVCIIFVRIWCQLPVYRCIYP
jgi:hypothetical protein